MAHSRKPPPLWSQGVQGEHTKMVAGLGKEEERLYYTKAAHLLFQYYESKGAGAPVPAAPEAQAELGAGQEPERNRHHRPVHGDQVLITSFLASSEPQAEADAAPPGESDPEYRGGTGTFRGMSRKELMNELLRRTGQPVPYERPSVSRNALLPSVSRTPCRSCGCDERTLMYNEAMLVCPRCDETEFILIDSDASGYREHQKEISYFCYKRQNHFQEWISQTQGREHTHIDDSVYDAIFLELKRRKVTNLTKVTPPMLKQIMKKLKLTRYYEHIPHIIGQIAGRCVASIPPELEAQLRRMFQQIQVPFRKHSPPERRNFLSYSFVLRKFVQLLGHDELMHNFPILKSTDKKHQQDQVWKKICKELGWQYIPSF